MLEGMSCLLGTLASCRHPMAVREHLTLGVGGTGQGRGGTSLQGGRGGVTGSSQWVLAMQWSWWWTTSLWVTLSIIPAQWYLSDYPQVACPDTLTVNDGTSTGGLSLGEFCGSNTPTVIHSLDSSMFISFSQAGSGSHISALWRKVPGKARSKPKWFLLWTAW